jgi:hypothetical protein
LFLNKKPFYQYIYWYEYIYTALQVDRKKGTLDVHGATMMNMMAVLTNARGVNGKLSANHKSHPKDKRENTPPTRGILLCLTSLCKTP